MQIIEKSIDELIPYENNPRKNDAAVEPTAASIQEFGFKVPIIIDRNNVIVAGHTRLKAAKKLGLKVVPCIMADDLTEEQVKAFRLADNKTAELAEWDFDMLEDEICEITEIDLTEFGFDINPEPEEVIEDCENIEGIEANADEKVKTGELWQLGEHRLYCGDATTEEAYVAVMGEEKATMCFADPPYGAKKEKDGVTNDNLNFDDLLEFNRQWIPLTLAALTDVGSWYCWGMDEPLMDIYSEILKPKKKEKEITFRNLITWDKGSTRGQKSNKFRKYAVADEKCLFIIKGAQGFDNTSENFFDGFDPIRKYLSDEAKKVNLTGKKLKEITGVGMHSHWFGKSEWGFIPEKQYAKLNAYYKGKAFGKEYEEIKKEYEEIKKEYEEIKKEYYATRGFFDNTHDNMNNVWHFQRARYTDFESGVNELHATPKPVELVARCIKTSSREKDVVLDPFGGSGTTIIAAEQCGRKACVIELEPHYCDVIIARWEEFTGGKAERIK